jgi:hypothetical protein
MHSFYGISGIWLSSIKYIKLERIQKHFGNQQV